MNAFTRELLGGLAAMSFLAGAPLPPPDVANPARAESASCVATRRRWPRRRRRAARVS